MAEPRTRSLTRRLVVGVLLAELVCAVCFSGAAVLHERRGRLHAFDVMLRGRADSVLGAVRDAEDPEDNVVVDPGELALPPGDLYVVLMENGRIIGATPNAPADDVQALMRHGENGVWDLMLHGRHFRALRQPGMRVIDREENGGFRRPVTIFYAAPTSHLWHEIMEAVRFYILASALFLLLTGFMIAWFLRRWLSPLRELAARAERVSAASWEFTPPAEALETRELAPIARSIEKLLDGLRGSFERQRRFTGDAAHELKTSVAVIKSSLQLLSLRERTPEEYRRSLDGLLADTGRMEDLTARMLALARIEEAPVEAAEVVDFGEVLRAVAERLRAAAEQRQTTLTVQAAEAAFEVAMPWADADSLVSNLLLNAIQHSDAGTAVQVRVLEQGGALELLIVNRGPGIPAEALPHVFERFFRADAARSRAHGGAGLGLAICKAIVDRAQGTIAITSRPGAETSVRVVLPVMLTSDAASSAELKADAAFSSVT